MPRAKYHLTQLLEQPLLPFIRGQKLANLSLRCSLCVLHFWYEGHYTRDGQGLLETGVDNPACVWLLAPGGPVFFQDTEMMFMTTAPQNHARHDYCYCQPSIRGPRAAVVRYSGTTISCAPVSGTVTCNDMDATWAWDGPV